MSKLESLVPPPELCEKIPANEFDGSVFAWHLRIETGERFVAIRGSSNPDEGIILFAPAPTLEEILAALACLELCPGIDLVVNIKGEVCGSVNAAWRKVDFCGGSQATAALKLWFDVEGI